jgi:hypothetical protein
MMKRKYMIEFIERGIERETREKPVIPVLDSSTLCIRARNLPGETTRKKRS